MAVYKKTYRPYEGALTPAWSRFLVIPRYAFEDLHRSRFLTIFFLASFIYPLICALIIYVQHNASALEPAERAEAPQRPDLHQRHVLHVPARLAEHAGAVPGGVHRARAWSRPIWPTTPSRSTWRGRFRASSTCSARCPCW